MLGLGLRVYGFCILIACTCINREVGLELRLRLRLGARVRVTR